MNENEQLNETPAEIAAENETNTEPAAQPTAEGESAEAKTEEKPEKKKEEKLTGKQKAFKEIREWVVSLVVALLVVMLCRSYLFMPIRVDGASMSPTLSNGDRLGVTAYDVRIQNKLQRGDVVICHYPGRTNKLLGLVPFYVAWVIPFSTFMIKGYIESIPREFDEAVYMDGGSVFTVFFKVICPLASPAIASVSIFNFLTAWEEFPWALTVLNDTQKRTLPIAISGFFGQHQFTQWGYVFAMSVASLLPVLIIFICCQKYFVSGLQTGGIKG